MRSAHSRFDGGVDFGTTTVGAEPALPAGERCDEGISTVFVGAVLQAPDPIAGGPVGMLLAGELPHDASPKASRNPAPISRWWVLEARMEGQPNRWCRSSTGW